MEWKPEVEAQVRSLLKRWASSMPGSPFPDFGDKVSFVSIAEKPSYVVQLNTLYEGRFRPIERTKPYSDAAGASLATGKTISPESVDIWSFESPLKNIFETQEIDIDVPDSYHAASCSICEGKSNVPCVACLGSKT